MMVGEGEPPTLKDIEQKRIKLTVYYLDYSEKAWYVVVLKEVI